MLLYKELWRLRSPKFAFNELETQEGGDVIPFQSESEGLRTRRADDVVPVWKTPAGRIPKKGQCFSSSPKVRGNKVPGRAVRREASPSYSVILFSSESSAGE